MYGTVDCTAAGPSGPERLKGAGNMAAAINYSVFMEYDCHRGRGYRVYPPAVRDAKFFYVHKSAFGFWRWTERTQDGRVINSSFTNYPTRRAAVEWLLLNAR